MTTTPTSGAADLPGALRSIQRFEVVDCIDDKHVPAVIPKPHGPWVRYEDHIAALAAGQATAAQAVVQDDPITIRKPTTSAEMLWLLKLAHLVISDVGKTLEETFAPAQPAAQQGVTYAERPEPLSKRPSEANTLVWVADPISSTGVRGVFVDDITCLWWWGAGLIFQKEADAAALALRMRSQVYNVFL